MVDGYHSSIADRHSHIHQHSHSAVGSWVDHRGLRGRMGLRNLGLVAEVVLEDHRGPLRTFLVVGDHTREVGSFFHILDRNSRQQEGDVPVSVLDHNLEDSSHEEEPHGDLHQEVHNGLSVEIVGGSFVHRVFRLGRQQYNGLSLP